MDNLITAEDVVSVITEAKCKTGCFCPYCRCEMIIKYGKHNGIQRYRCKKCKKTFSAMSFTPMNKTHYIKKWPLFIECMILGYSLRKSAKILGVTWVTLFYWRHKILNNLKHKNVKSFKKIVEIHDIYFAYSEKGSREISKRKPRKRGYIHKSFGKDDSSVCVINVKDSEGGTLSKVTCLGIVSKSKIEKVIGKYINKGNILCTREWREYKNFARIRGMKYYPISNKDMNSLYNIKRIKKYTNKLKVWINRFCGVASKYLDNYLAWYKLLDYIKFICNKKNIKNMIIDSCSYVENDTFESLRLSKFVI